MPFCYAPWTNIDVSPQGEISPCCKFQMSYYDSKFNVQTQNLDNYFDSGFLALIKNEFQQDTWPLGCERCKVEEQNNIPSKRQLDYNRWHTEYNKWESQPNRFLTASIAFGNTCNLKCITCNSYSSSRWRDESLALTGQAFDHVKFYRQNFVEQFVSKFPNIVHLDIPGGEPFLSGVSEQKKLLQHYVDSGQAQNVSLHYTTNATYFPDTSWWHLWRQFAHVDIQLSIDGIASKYEYIRFPSKWSDICRSVEQYLNCSQSNLQLSVSHTVSAYNIFYLDDFLAWCKEIGLPIPWLGRVHNPPHMRPTIWPDLTRQEIIAKLQDSKFSQVDAWVSLLTNTDDSKWYPMFCQKVKQHDQYRSTNFKSTFPEMALWLI